MVRPLAPALLLAVLTARASAQEPPRPIFSGGLDAVNVTVAVRDDRGRLVSDLRREDFVVREDGRPQEVLLFARAFEPGQDETLGLDLGLLFDTSESMLKELRLSQEAAVRFLDAIPRARELFTIFFADDIHLSRYDSENQQGLIERIQDAQGGGGTALYDAIATYLARVQGSSGRKVLVLFTDGEDFGSRLTAGETIDLVRNSAVTVYPIAFTGGFSTGSARGFLPMAFLSQLADLTGGQVFRPSTSKDLPVIYEKILDELRAQYVLGFASDRPDGGGGFRKLRVEVKGKGLKVRHRMGYYARPVLTSEAARRPGPERAGGLRHPEPAGHDPAASEHRVALRFKDRTWDVRVKGTAPFGPPLPADCPKEKAYLCDSKTAEVRTEIIEQNGLWTGLSPQGSGSTDERTRQWAELALWYPGLSAAAGATSLENLNTLPLGNVELPQGVSATGRNVDFTRVGGDGGQSSAGSLSHSYLQILKYHEVWKAYRVIRGIFAQ